jgi:AcrR family transcriptional regulator
MNRVHNNMGIAERKEKEKREMREVILETARKLFVEEGFDKVTIRRIAEKIEYSPATIYLYFKDKDEILFALHSEGFEKFYKQQQTVLSIQDPWERLRKHGEVYVSFALGNPEYYDLMFIMRAPIKEMKAKKEWEVGMRSYELLKDNIKSCMDAGYLPHANLDVAAFAIWSLTHGIVSLVIRDRTAKFPAELLPSIINGALDFMMSGIAKRK